jgi:transcriptional antiterminator RfaH
MSEEAKSSAIAELCAGSKPPWLCVRSHLKHEHIAAAQLRQLSGVEVFNPQIRLLRSTRRGQVWSTESLFPNYLFARFCVEAVLEKVRYTPGVKYVLQFGDRIPAVPDTVIQELRQSLEQMKSQVLTDIPMEGEEVEVAAGAFRGLTGPVARILPGKQRVQILLDVMGRSTAAELSLDLVLFRRRDVASLVLDQVEAIAREARYIRGIPMACG